MGNGYLFMRAQAAHLKGVLPEAAADRRLHETKAPGSDSGSTPWRIAAWTRAMLNRCHRLGHK